MKVKRVEKSEGLQGYPARIFLLLILFCFNAAGGNLALSVSDASTGEALEGAHVKLSGPSFLLLQTGRDGKAAFSGLDSGVYTLSVSRDAYQAGSRELPLDFSRKENYRASVRLFRIGEPAAELSVLSAGEEIPARPLAADPLVNEDADHEASISAGGRQGSTREAETEITWSRIIYRTALLAAALAVSGFGLLSLLILILKRKKHPLPIKIVLGAISFVCGCVFIFLAVLFLASFADFGDSHSEADGGAAAAQMESEIERGELSGKETGRKMRMLAEEYYLKAVEAARMSEENADRQSFIKAVAYCEAALELDPEAPHFWMLLGDLYHRINHVERAKLMAEAALERSLELRPDNPPCRLLLARVLFEQAEYSDALAVYTETAEKYPDALTPGIIELMGQCYLLDGRFEQGGADFSALSAKYPENKALSIAAAVMLNAAGNPEKADTMLSLAAAGDSELAEYAGKLLLAWRIER